MRITFFFLNTQTINVFNIVLKTYYQTKQIFVVETLSYLVKTKVESNQKVHVETYRKYECSVFLMLGEHVGSYSLTKC